MAEQIPTGYDISSMPPTVRQYGTSANVHYRWELNNLAEHPVDFYDETFRDFGRLLDDASNRIVDVGSADGTTGLINGIVARGIKASVYAVESSLGMLESTRVAPLPSNLNFVNGSAEHLPFPDNAMQAYSCHSTLYYCDNPLLALAEAARVVEPDGLLAFSTNSINSKPEFRMLERIITEVLNLKPIAAPAAPWPAETASLVLPQLFNMTDIVPQRTTIEIDNPEKVEIVLSALNTTADSFEDPTIPKIWRGAVQTIARPIIEQTMRNQGRFVIHLDRTLYICRNTSSDFMD